MAQLRVIFSKLKKRLQNAPFLTMRLDHTFLLIFHGGLLAYLILHNLIIPIIRNLGSDKTWTSDLHFWFFPHLFLHLALILNSPRPYLRIPIWVLVSFGVFVLTCGFYIYQITQFSAENLFSETLTLLAQVIFFCTFLLSFKSFFKWSDLKFKDVIYSLVIIMLIFPSQVLLSKKLETYKKKEVLSFESDSIEEIIVENLKEISLRQEKDRAIWVKENNSFVLKNNIPRDVLLRLDKMRGDIFRSHKNINFSLNSAKDIKLKSGLYRIRAPQVKEMGKIYLLVGDEYKLTKKIILKQEGVDFVR